MNGDAGVGSSDARAPLIPVYDPLIRRSRSFNSALRSIFTLQNFYILLGPLLCALICLFVKLNDSVSGRNMLAVVVWIFTWWLTEAVPMPITAMAPMFLFPLFGIAGADEVARSYSDDVITLILGSFILALAVEHYNIHRRLAFNITLIFCGDPLNPPLLILGICATTAFISMWMTNVAAAVMMMPAATGILQSLPSAPAASSHQKDTSNFCKAMVLGVIYSATIGGMCTQTGTGVNLILAGIWKSYYPQEDPITFNTWFFFGFPVGLLIFISMWGILCLLYCRRGLGSVLSEYMNKGHLKRELDLLGPITFAEKMILAIFSVLVVLWMTRSITDDIPGWGALFHGRASDGTVSVMMATLLFIIPNKRKQGEKLMDWDKCKKLPWNIILLLGAGFAIADGIKTSGLANNATATLLIPLLVQVAQTMHVHPLLLMVPCSIGAQFPFVVPTGTPSNIVGFTTGHIEIKDMIKVGLPLKIAGVLIVSILMPTLGTLVFGTDKQIRLSF